MNPDILILIVSSLPYLSMGVLLYFVAVRKNAFEERVAHYIPYHALERERSTYMEKVEKYKRYICIGLGIFLSVFIVLPFVLFFVMGSYWMFFYATNKLYALLLFSIIAGAKGLVRGVQRPTQLSRHCRDNLKIYFF